MLLLTFVGLPTPKPKRWPKIKFLKDHILYVIYFQYFILKLKDLFFLFKRTLLKRLYFSIMTTMFSIIVSPLLATSLTIFESFYLDMSKF